jgi:hypothetical protein
MPSTGDLVQQSTTTTGTGNLTVASVNGRRTFATVFGTGGTTNVFWYFVMSRDNSDWEHGTGHMSDSTTLVRDTVISSSNSNALVNFGSGTKDITSDQPTSERVYKTLDNALTSATDSTSTSTGALKLTGGLGAQGSIHFGTSIAGAGATAGSVPGVGNTNTGFDCYGGYVAVSRGAATSLFLNQNADGTLAWFGRSGTNVGSISVTTTATAFNTSSDRDRKRDNKPFADAERIIRDLKIWDFEWRDAPGVRGVGVFAQEAREVWRDPVTSSEQPGGWMTDYSRYVPVLIARVQELSAELADLRKRIDGHGN